MEKNIGEAIASATLQQIMDSVMPGGLNWDSSNEGCLSSCPHYQPCKGNGPDRNICSSDWRKSEQRPDVLDVAFHVFNNFDHYNKADLPKENAQSEDVKKLRSIFVELLQSLAFSEGEPRLRNHIYRERNSRAAKILKERALKSKQVVCAGCDTNFFALYGELSINLIECHHLVPLASNSHRGVTQIKDLALLCANCHRLVHSKKIGLRLENLRSIGVFQGSCRVRC